MATAPLNNYMNMRSLINLLEAYEEGEFRFKQIDRGYYAVHTNIITGNWQYVGMVERVRAGRRWAWKAKAAGNHGLVDIPGLFRSRVEAAKALT